MESKDNPLKNFTIFTVVIIVIFVIVAILFFWHYPPDCSMPVAESVWGTLGDFIGGVLGTAVALYGAKLLIETLRSQESINEDVKKTNQSVIATNKSAILTNQSVLRANNAAIKASENEAYYSEMMLFDTVFRSYLDSYRETKKANKEVFDTEVKDFLSRKFDNKNDYARRTDSASYEYADFYAQNRELLSVHYRTLYLIVAYISESAIDDEEKRKYAKLIRGQLSENEMLILRYNCLSVYGVAAREHCNTYNLLKHLPIMSLLEFSKYQKKLKEVVDNEIKDKDESKVEYNELVGGLDMMFITLKKIIADLFYLDKPISNSYDPGNPNRKNSEYSITVSTDISRKTFNLILTKNEGVEKRGGGYRSPAAEKAMDKFSDDELSDLFEDFLNELFRISNYHLYNNRTSINSKKPKRKDNVLTCEYTIKSEKRLILSTYQN